MTPAARMRYVPVEEYPTGHNRNQAVTPAARLLAFHANTPPADWVDPDQAAPCVTGLCLQWVPVGHGYCTQCRKERA